MTSALPFTLEYDDFNFIFCFIQPQFRIQAKEKISDAARQTSEDGFFNPSTLEQFTAGARRAAEEASRSVQEASRTLKEASEDITAVSKNTIGDFTKSAKHAAAKGGLLKVNVNELVGAQFKGDFRF